MAWSGLEQEFEQWAKHAPDHYSLMLHRRLEWPSLTVQWLPRQQQPGPYMLHDLIVGTRTTPDEQSYLALIQLHSKPDNKFQLQTVQKINVDADVHRARYMPANPSIIATRIAKSEVYVFECGKQPSSPLTGECIPDLRLKGHSDEGFALSWSQHKPGILLSGGYDSKICVWDVNKEPENHVLHAVETCKLSGSTVEDVAWWNKRHDNLFGSVGSDGRLLICDPRMISEPSQTVVAHDREVSCLAFNPFDEWLVITGSEDNTVKLFDLRGPSKALKTFCGHLDAVLQVGWNPAQPSVFASASFDKNIMVWDINRTDNEQTAEEASKGQPPELLFKHGGHTNTVSDLTWNPCEEWLVASVDQDNALQIWKVGDHVYADDEDIYT